MYTIPELQTQRAFWNVTSIMAHRIRFVKFVGVCMRVSLALGYHICSQLDLVHPLHGCAQHTVPFGIGEVRKDWFFYFTLKIIIMTPLTLFTCTSCQYEPISSSLSPSAPSSPTENTAQTFITVILVSTPAQASAVLAALGSDTCQKQLLYHATSSWHQSS